MLSYFLLRGRCRACKQPFSARYPLVEALAGAARGGAVVEASSPAIPVRRSRSALARFAVYFAFAGVLVVLSFIDLATHAPARRHHAAGDPDLLRRGFAAHHAPWLERLIGAAAGYLFLRIIADFYYYVLKREGLGLGDAKLLALIGALLGWRSLLFVLVVGGFAGTLISLPIVVVDATPAASGRIGASRSGMFRSRSGRSSPARRWSYVFVGPRLLALMAGG